MGCLGSREAEASDRAALIGSTSERQLVSCEERPDHATTAKQAAPLAHAEADAQESEIQEGLVLPHTPCAVGRDEDVAAKPEYGLAGPSEDPTEPRSADAHAQRSAIAQPTEGAAVPESTDEGEVAVVVGNAKVPAATDEAPETFDHVGGAATGAQPSERASAAAEAAPAVEVAAEAARPEDPWQQLILSGAVRPHLSWHDAAAADNSQTLAWHLSQVDSRSACLDTRGEDKVTALHVAARAGALGACRYLLLQGADPFAQDRDRGTPLHMAALGGHLPAVELLLDPAQLWAQGEADLGAAAAAPESWPDISTADLWRRTPLHKAAEGGGLEVLRLLIRRKAAVDKSDREGNDPLHKAVAAGHGGVVAELLRHPRTQSDSANNDGLSPLDLCVQARRCDVGDMLVATKARLVKDARKKPVTMLDAAQSGLPFLCTYLFRHDTGVGAASVKQQLKLADEDGLTPPLVAARAGSTEFLNRLLQGRADLTAASPCGRLLVHEAAASGQQEVAAWLLEHSADMSALDAHGRPALFHAAEGGHTELFRWLVERGLSPAARDSQERTPLHAAAAGGQRAMCEALLSSAGDAQVADLIGTEDWEGATAGHLAIRAGHAGVCELLAERRADLRATLDFGVTSLQVAAEHGHESVLQLLLADLAGGGADGLTAAALQRRVSDGRCAWLLAAAEGFKPCAVRIWEATNGTSVISSAVDRDGRDALLLAARGGHVEVSGWLLDAKACASGVAVVDDCGWTPLHMSAAEGHRAVVQLLLDARADVAAVDVDGKTSRDWASIRRHLAIEALLRDTEKSLAASQQA